MDYKEINSLMAKCIRERNSPIEKSINNIDYEDIYDNIDDYEYPYNHINREGV